MIPFSRYNALRSTLSSCTIVQLCMAIGPTAASTREQLLLALSSSGALLWTYQIRVPIMCICNVSLSICVCNVSLSSTCLYCMMFVCNVSLTAVVSVRGKCSTASNVGKCPMPHARKPADQDPGNEAFLSRNSGASPIHQYTNTPIHGTRYTALMLQHTTPSNSQYTVGSDCAGNN